jgi:hypothetical protein
VALLVLQKTLSCFDGSSSSTHSNKQQPLWIFVSLGQSWNPAAVASVFSCHILQCLILLALQQQQKITAAVFVAVEFSDIKAR